MGENPSELDAKRRTLLRRLLSGGGWSLFGSIGGAGLGLAENAVLARLLAPEEMAAYFVLFSIVTVGAVFAQQGLPRTVVRYIAASQGVGDHARARAATRAVFLYGTAATLVVAGVLIAGVGDLLAQRVFHSERIGDAMQLAGLWLVVVSYRGVVAETFRGFHDIRLAALFGKILHLLIPISLYVTALLLYGSSDLSGVLLMAIGGSGISVAIGGVTAWARVRRLPAGGSVSLAELVSEAFPILVTDMMRHTFTQAALWILAAYSVEAEVALYGAALRLAALTQMPLLVMNGVLPPIIAELYAQGRKEDLEAALRGTATLASLPSAVVLIVFALAAGPILGLVYGDFYSEAGPALAVLSLGWLLNACTGACGLALLMTGHQRTRMVLTLFEAIVMVTLALALVPSHGIIGAAIATSAVNFVDGVVAVIAVKRLAGVWTHVGPGQLRSAISLVRRQITARGTRAP